MIAYGALLVGFGRRSEPVADAMISLATGSRYSGMFCGLCGVGRVAFVAATI